MHTFYADIRWVKSFMVVIEKKMMTLNFSGQNDKVNRLPMPFHAAKSNIRLFSIG